MEMVHEGLVFELALETTGIAQTVPRFDAYEGSLLLVGTPESDDRGAEVDCYYGIACFVEQLGTVYLALVDLHTVVAPRVVAELDDAVFGLYGDLDHLVRAVDIALQSVERLLVVEADTAILTFAHLHVGDVEGGMTTDLEVDLAGVGIVDMPDDTDLIVVEDVADGEGEVVGIDLLRGLGGFEGEGDLTLALGNQFEVGVAGETMTGKVVRLAIDGVGVVVDTAHDGEEDR